MITLLILSLLGVTAMVFDFFPFKRFLPWKVIAGLGLVLGLLAYEYYNPIEIGIFKGMLQFNHLAILFSAGLVVLFLLWVLLAWPGLQSFKHRTEFYALLIFSLCGGLIMVSYTNLVMFWALKFCLSPCIFWLEAIKTHWPPTKPASSTF